MPLTVEAKPIEQGDRHARPATGIVGQDRLPEFTLTAQRPATEQASDNSGKPVTLEEIVVKLNNSLDFVDFRDGDILPMNQTNIRIKGMLNARFVLRVNGEEESEKHIGTRTVVTETDVGFRTILGAISVYTILGLLFTFLYVGLDRIQSTPFFGTGVSLDRGDFLFFSFTTLTTTGYGNLIPAAQPGKMFAGLEMLMGQIFLVTLVAGLVSLWRPGGLIGRRRASQGRSAQS
jgi:hypothetical protein